MASTIFFADTILFNGTVYTADSNNTVTEALAVKDGYILATGTSSEIKKLAGPATTCIDLQGKTAMPGIVDSHMHPYWGAKLAGEPSLGYAQLTLQETLQKVQALLDADHDAGDDDWFIVHSWLRVEMLPVGTDVTRYDLDALQTKRPVLLFSSDCHYLTANSRALQLLGVDEHTPEPNDGFILKDARGIPNGLIEDGPAMRIYDEISTPSVKTTAKYLEMAQHKLHMQGVTTIFDARAEESPYQALALLREQKRLAIRVVSAREITSQQTSNEVEVEAALHDLINFSETYSGNAEWTPEPDIDITHAKLFLDGMLQNKTGYVLEPYYENFGTPEEGDWRPGSDRGVPYFTERQLTVIIDACAKYGIHPHLHIIADGSLELALNAFRAMRNNYPDKDIRPSVAHGSLVENSQYSRMAKYGIIATLSLQWSAATEQIIKEHVVLLGKKRFANFETAGKFIDAGVLVAYGSDWPVDPLDEWHNFQVGMTRRGSADTPRLYNDRDLSLIEVLRAATINAAYSIGKERYIGSLEKGKLADLIVVDRDLFQTPAEAIGETRVVFTMLGGKPVYEGR